MWLMRTVAIEPARGVAVETEHAIAGREMSGDQMRIKLLRTTFLASKRAAMVRAVAVNVIQRQEFVRVVATTGAMPTVGVEHGCLQRAAFRLQFLTDSVSVIAVIAATALAMPFQVGRFPSSRFCARLFQGSLSIRFVIGQVRGAMFYVIGRCFREKAFAVLQIPRTLICSLRHWTNFNMRLVALEA